MEVVEHVEPAELGRRVELFVRLLDVQQHAAHVGGVLPEMFVQGRGTQADDAVEVESTQRVDEEANAGVVEEVLGLGGVVRVGMQKPAGPAHIAVRDGISKRMTEVVLVHLSLGKQRAAAEVPFDRFAPRKLQRPRVELLVRETWQDFLLHDVPVSSAPRRFVFPDEKVAVLASSACGTCVERARVVFAACAHSHEQQAGTMLTARNAV